MDLRDFHSAGHWYTSFPSLNHWTEDFGHDHYAEAFTDYVRNAKSDGGLHLYAHIPFCKKLCSYCLCNILVTNDRDKIQNFVNHMLKEMANLRTYGKLDVKEIHLGGGTPSHLDREQFSAVCKGLDEIAPLSDTHEFAMEIDPRTVTQDDLRHYAAHGVNRISFGVQDFNLKVQEAINRVQPPEMIWNLLRVRHLFRGVNFDLLYGLPLQTMETFGDTITRTIEMRPERITLLKYCHAPEIRKHMRLINVTDLPQPQDLEAMFRMALDRLTDAGYVWVGLDHFALPHDSLAVSHKRDTVVRTFNGFKAGPTRYMVGLGPTSTYSLRNTYAQAHYDLNDYYRAVTNGQFPIFRGVKLSHADMAARRVIFDLLCKQSVEMATGDWGGILNELEGYPDLVSIERDPNTTTLRVKPEGRVYLRNICKLFDHRDIAPEHLKIAQKSITRKAVAA